MNAQITRFHNAIHENSTKVKDTLTVVRVSQTLPGHSFINRAKDVQECLEIHVSHASTGRIPSLNNTMSRLFFPTCTCKRLCNKRIRGIDRT